MGYITQQDLEDELGPDKLVQLTDDQETGDVGDARMNRAIAYAEGTFDSYARARYTIPVSATTKVKATCLDLAVFHLVKGRVSTDEGVYKVRKDAHDAAMAFLKDLAAGRAALDVPTAEETVDNPASADEVLRASDVNPGKFSDENLSGY